MSHARLNSDHQQVNNELNNEQTEEHSEEMLETVGNLLHTFSDTTLQAHAGGIHLPRGLHQLGLLAGVGAEIIHDPSSNTAERIVCGVGVGLLREGDKL